MSDRSLHELTHDDGGAGTSNPQQPQDTAVSPANVIDGQIMDQNGIRPHLDLSEYDVGFAGKSFINNLTGRLTHLFNGFSTVNVKHPIGIGLYHMSVRPTGNFNTSRNFAGQWWLCFDYGVLISESAISIASPDGFVSRYQRYTRQQALDNFNIRTTLANVYVNLDDYSFIERRMAPWILLIASEIF